LLHDSGEDSLGDVSADLNGVLTILKDLWLDDWHETILLADGTVSCERMSGLGDSNLSWTFVSNLNYCSPLSESASKGIIFSASSTESVKTLGGGLLISSSDDLESSVNLDTAVNSS